MYITIDDETIMPRNFIVSNFYGVETFFCWDISVSKVVIFPYISNDSSPDNVRVLSTPAPIRRIQSFGNKIFIICEFQGVYKLSQDGVFALLSRNALEIANYYYKVLIPKRNSICLDDKQLKSSKQLFQCSVTSNAIELYAYTLIPEDTKQQLLKCFIKDEQIKDNVCIISCNKKVFALVEDTVQLIYTDDANILNIAPVKLKNKVAALLFLINVNTVILMHSNNQGLVFEKIYLRRNVRCAAALCAGFSSQSEKDIWILYCDQSKLYYVKKELLSDKIQEKKVENKSFVCLQHYKPNVILGLSEKKELMELYLQTLENSLCNSDNIELCSDMFEKTNPIMDKIYSKVKELEILYNTLTKEQDKLRRINIYTSKQKLKANPSIVMSKMWNQCHLTLNISEKLPKSSYIVFRLDSKSRCIISVKKVVEEFSMHMPVNESRIKCSSIVNIDMITLINKEAPWCLIKNFINYSPQAERRKRLKDEKEKIAFINAKITSLENLIAEKDLTLTKLSEIKRIVRAEL